jgi:dihydroorotase-like cyclic amidohydrolase
VVWDAATKGHAYARGVDIRLAGGKVAAIAPHGPVATADEVIEGSALLVLPGLVNVHTHPTTEPSIRGVREIMACPSSR